MISWYLNRIKTFSLLEYPYRAKQVVQKKFEELFVQKKVPAAKTCIVEKTLLHPFGLDGQLPDASIDIFGKSFDFSDPQKIEWHKDIFSNQSFPRIFSKNISILKNPSLSAKVVWEINRLQFLQKIALHYNSTNDPNSLQLFVSIMKSWIIANPFMIGINWYSNIEINLRLINWFVCWELLDADSLIIEDDTFKEFSEKFWIPSIYHHCIYSFRNPSKHSSANNHLISEYAGLFVASSKWKFREWKKWNNYAAVGLEKEIAKQHSENGVNKEEAAEYIQFITDFFLISFIVAERTGKLFSSTYSSYLHNIFKYISVLLDCNGNFPKYGDEDDGRCFDLSFEQNFNNFRSLLVSGAIIFKDSELARKGNNFDLKNKLFFGERGESIFATLTKSSEIETSKFYSSEGHFFFKKIDDSGEIYLHFDAAPLGFLSIAAHGHADALSIILHVDGNPILVDPGTYIYHTEKEWRNYFVSTLAHNTISIDGMNQALQGGPTLWLRHYKAEVCDSTQTDTLDSVDAAHNGFKAIGCSHTRSVRFFKEENKFLITDKILTDNNGHQILQPWHLHPLTETKLLGQNCYEFKHKLGNKKVKITLDPKLKIDIVTGQLSPILGWYSRSFMEKERTSVFLGKMTSLNRQIIQLETVIEIYK